MWLAVGHDPWQVPYGCRQPVELSELFHQGAGVAAQPVADRFGVGAVAPRSVALGQGLFKVAATQRRDVDPGRDRGRARRVQLGEQLEQAQPSSWPSV